MPRGAYLFAAGLVLGAAGALGLGWKLWRPKMPPRETPAPQIQQQDGSLVLQRVPQASVKPSHAIPVGGKVEREVHLTVETRPQAPTLPSIPTGDLGIPGPGAKLPELAPQLVHVDLSLVRMPDLTRRVVASSPDGQVVGGIDIPVEPEKPAPKPLKWAAGLDYTVTSWGNIKSVVAQRQLGPLVIGGHVGIETITPPGGGTLRGGAAGITAMIRF